MTRPSGPGSFVFLTWTAAVFLAGVYLGAHVTPVTVQQQTSVCPSDGMIHFGGQHGMNLTCQPGEVVYR